MKGRRMKGERGKMRICVCVLWMLAVMANTVIVEATTCEYIDEVSISLPTESGARIDATTLKLPGTAVISVVRLCDAACDDECGNDWGKYTKTTYCPDSVSEMNATQLMAWWPEGRVAWTQLVDAGRFVLDVLEYDEATNTLSFPVLDGSDVDMVFDDAVDIVVELVPLPRRAAAAEDTSVEDEASAPESECASAANIVEAFVSGAKATLTNTTLSLQFEEDMDITTAVLCNVECSDACASNAQWQGIPLAVQYLLSSSASVSPEALAASLSSSNDSSYAIMSGTRDDDGSSVSYKLMLRELSFDAVTNVMEFASTVVDADVVDQGARKRRRRILSDEQVPMTSYTTGEVPVTTNFFCFTTVGLGNPFDGLNDVRDLPLFGSPLANKKKDVQKEDPCVCLAVYAPVCDFTTGRTYSNECSARCDGVNMNNIQNGEC